MLTLRPYQQRVLDDLWQWFADHPDGDPIVEACVGAGKSVLIAELCRRAITQHPGTRILMLVHSKELIEQNLAKLIAVWPDAPVGAYSASMGARQLGRAITYATIGSVRRRAHELGHVDLVLVDECHLISDDEATMYQRLISDLRQYCPAMRVIGWTGTPFRGDGVWLTQGSLFTHIAARVTMRELLDEGYLAPLVRAETTERIDTSGVRTQGGDYVVSALAEASDRADIVRRACAEIVRLAEQRQRWLVFAVTVEHAKHIADELRGTHGVSCAVVSAKTPKPERERLIADSRAGRLRALVNVAVLTTGFDVPEIDCIALLRATRSPVLYVQIAGRGMRMAPGKRDCLWLDFTDTTALLGPVDQVKGRARPPKSTAEAPVKHCENCGNPSPAGAAECAVCGHKFPPPQRIQHADFVDTRSAVMSTDVVWHSVTRIDYSRHPGKDGKPDTLRVDYWSLWRRVASEFVCIEHTGYPRLKAEQWWRKRSDLPAPESIDEALERIHAGELREPSPIAVQMEGKYPRVVSVRFDEHKEAA